MRPQTHTLSVCARKALYTCDRKRHNKHRLLANADAPSFIAAVINMLIQHRKQHLIQCAFALKPLVN
jgi:hypothetical protein